jgi:hypothetical protein
MASIWRVFHFQNVLLWSKMSSFLLSAY